MERDENFVLVTLEGDKNFSPITLCSFIGIRDPLIIFVSVGNVEF